MDYELGVHILYLPPLYIYFNKEIFNRYERNFKTIIFDPVFYGSLHEN